MFFVFFGPDDDSELKTGLLGAKIEVAPRAC
jgi:hypothetical protein